MKKDTNSMFCMADNSEREIGVCYVCIVEDQNLGYVDSELVPVA